MLVLYTCVTHMNCSDFISSSHIINVSFEKTWPRAMVEMTGSISHIRQVHDHETPLDLLGGNEAGFKRPTLAPCKSVYSDSHGDRCVNRAGTRKRREQKTGACSSYSPAVAMDQRSLQEEFKDQFTDVVSRLQSKQLFQSDWDIASFAVFFIFIGMVLLLVVLVLIRCCCCCCCDEQPRRHKVGHENFGMET
ncbi:small integral membrane protein 22 isoform X1 [Oncorhynchus keta]|uniref:uncharacterized protein LOC127918403 isoform X2 n=1 Tax=Oncorhynchus keta TaxID=8018 RepID=UPI00227ADC2F|nr:uncharacterized protein LOC127918403 isoform X2 [Oncorhynchus keta]XP_052375797.1 small integral membrane protein 22 isoform X1 [Oncorhynchus keta]